MEHHVAAGENRLWTIREGEGPSVLLCNGGPGCSDYLQPVADLMKEESAIIRFEQRGCGRSKDTGPYGLIDCINDLEAIREYYQVDQWVIGGHSWGADLALAYTLHYPDRVKATISIAGTGIQNDRDWKAAYQNGRHREEKIIPRGAADFNSRVNQCVTESWHDFIKSPGIFKNVSHIETPFLFIHGSEDIRPSWPLEQIAELIADSAYHEIHGATHYLWQDHEQECRELLSDFIRLTNR